jgi:hypothetical protein
VANAARFNGNAPRVTAFVPAGWYACSGRIDLPDYVELKGEGGSTTIASWQGYAHTPVTIGIPTGGLDPKYRPDPWNGGNPKLDATAITGPGQRHSIATNGDAFINAPASPFSHGGAATKFQGADAWTETRKLTQDFAIEGPKGGPIPAGAALFGVGDYAGSSPGVFFLRVDAPNVFTLLVSTQAARHEDWSSRSVQYFRFSTGAATGVQRIAVSLDLDAGKVRAYGNGVQLDVQPFVTTTWPDPKRSLNENRYDSWSMNHGASPPSGPYFDWTLHGYSVRRSCPYADDGAGRPQRRIDGGPIGDRWRYFPTAPVEWADVIGYLPLDEPDTTQRDITIQGGGASYGGFHCVGYLITPGVVNSSKAGVAEIAIRGGPGYGYGVMMGAVLGTRFRGVEASGGLVGIGNMPWGANYTITLDD